MNVNAAEQTFNAVQNDEAKRLVADFKTLSYEGQSYVIGELIREISKENAKLVLNGKMANKEIQKLREELAEKDKIIYVLEHGRG